VERHGREIERAKCEVLEVRQWGEYTPTKFKKYLASEGIEHHTGRLE